MKAFADFERFNISNRITDECQLRVKSAVPTIGRPLSIYPDNRTFSDFGGMSEKCQEAAFLQSIDTECSAIIVNSSAFRPVFLL
jgi:hypothetical protein